jgi:non-ribosomal peptide synthase protein (TIGR01720 family)
VPLPRDRSGANTQQEVETLAVSLTPPETQALLQTVPAVYQTQINDVLLTALVQAFTPWTGSPTLGIELEGHGREDWLDGTNLSTDQSMDLSRTIGWFTTLFPVWLNLEANQVEGHALKSIKEQLRQIPQNGLGYGILRYLAPDGIQAQLRDMPRPEVRFNYLGQIDQALLPPFAPAPESVGATRSPRNPRDILLEINGIIAAGQLRLTWSYSRDIHYPSTIQTLADRTIHHLRHLIHHCQSPQSGGYTPSDFPLMSLNQSELDDLLADL